MKILLTKGKRTALIVISSSAALITFVFVIVLEHVGGVSEGNPAELHPLGEASFNVHDCGNDTQPITNETATGFKSTWFPSVNCTAAAYAQSIYYIIMPSVLKIRSINVLFITK